MSLPAFRSRARRDADNELYDRGCDLVEAAAAIRRGVGDPDVAQAIPALLGCVEAALHELRLASADLESRHTAVDPRRRVIVDRLKRGYANLRVALDDAEAASAAARSLAARRNELGR